MTANVIPTFQVEQFSTNIQMLLQQKQSKFSEAVTHGSYVGKQASPVDQVGAIEMVPVTTRFAPMGRVDASTARRWVYPSDFELPQLVDSFDQLRLIVDPESTLVQTAVAAANRQKDRLIYNAIFGTAQTGEQGATNTAFSTTNVVPVNTGGTSSNLNVAKLIYGQKLLMAAQVDLDAEPLYCAITSVEHASLLNEIQVINKDYNQAAVMESGRIKSFLGINFIHYEYALTGTDDQSGTSKQIPLWVKSGMHLGVWGDVQSSVSIRRDLSSEPWQVYTKMTAGATRIEELRLVNIWCH